ncbi:MAG TPA: ABC transporter permease [Candidatus Acidoferrum sp.]|nr:ABC transporter permease [Candidatus Acidoferrum sp.]
MNDLKFAFRQLLKNPGFTAMAVLTLALGIGANTSMFTMLNALLLRSLPYPDADRLVRAYRTSPQSQAWPHSAADFLDQREQNNVFDHMAAFSWWNFNFAEPGEPAERIRGMRATSDFFSVLGVQPALGRGFTAEEDQPGRAEVVVLSHTFWLRRFAADTNMPGRTLRLDGKTVTVVGVMPKSFEERMQWGVVDIWMPLAFTAEQRTSRGDHSLHAIARLKSGVSLSRAQAAMTALAARLAKAFPETNAQSGLRLVSLRDSAADDAGRRIIWLTFGLAIFVLLIACANLANLQLVRTVARSRELAVRAALGAGRARLVRQLLTESLLLALFGGALGVLLAVWMNEFLARRIIINDEAGLALTLDAKVLGFAVICSVLVGAIFGILPAWFASRADVNVGLKESVRGGTAGRAQHRLRNALIVGEVALALMLLTGAGLFIGGLQRFTHLDPGWRVDGLLTARLALTASKYDSSQAQRAFTEQLEQRLAALPGVQRTALSSMLPIWGLGSRDFVVEGRPASPAGQQPLTYEDAVTPGFFDTFGIRLRQGRFFTAGDTTNRPGVVIINEAMARRFWPNESPLGKRIGSGDTKNPDWQEIVGVVSDTRFPANLVGPDTRFQSYRPLAQDPRRWLVIELRTEGSAESLTPALRRTIAEIDPDLPVFEIQTVRQRVDQTLANGALISVLLGAFAVLGLVLAAVGIYGVISYSVAQRTGEIGIRMALGAQRSDVLRLVLQHGLRLSLLGVLIGFIGALAVVRLLTTAVPEMPSRDPITFAALSLTLIAVALMACWLPARRATQVDPMEALRHE